MRNYEAEIAEHEKAIAALREERESLPVNTAEKRLATLLHAKKCRLMHEDQCGWYYEEDYDSPARPKWEDYSHKHYLTEARNLLGRMPGKDPEDIIAVMEALG